MLIYWAKKILRNQKFFSLLNNQIFSKHEKTLKFEASQGLLPLPISYFIMQVIGLDFINALRTAFTPVVPQSVGTQSSRQYLFTLLGLCDFEIDSFVCFFTIKKIVFFFVVKNILCHQRRKPLGLNSQNFLSQIRKIFVTLDL